MSIIKSAYLELVKVLSPVRHARMIGVALGTIVWFIVVWNGPPNHILLQLAIMYNSPKGLQYIHMEEEM